MSETPSAQKDTRRLAYAIHEAVCTAYKHEGRNALCDRAARAVYQSDWFDALVADVKAGHYDDRPIPSGRRSDGDEG